MGRHRSRPAPGIVVTRTPLRISFAGGGTDLPAFYERDYGAVLSTTIDKYVYVTVKRHGELFGEVIRLNYSETEQAGSIDEVRNDIARESLRFLEVETPIYVSTVADIPAASGLGSSSAFAVGLLNALHAYLGQHVSAGQLAEEAAHIEIEVLKRPVGKQDHFASAFGGFNFLRFQSDGSVSVESQRFWNDGLASLFEHVMVLWTEISRGAHEVLDEQRQNTPGKLGELTAMRHHAHKLQALLRHDFDPATFGGTLDETWRAKQSLARGITSEQIDKWYQLALEAGALGGKLCGAGGGGFLLFIVPPELREAVRGALDGLAELQVRYEPRGTRVLIPHVE